MQIGWIAPPLSIFAKIDHFHKNEKQKGAPALKQCLRGTLCDGKNPPPIGHIEKKVTPGSLRYEPALCFGAFR